jgi:hypothetical protein
MVSEMVRAATELSVEQQAEPDTDAGELDQLLVRLRAELLDLDVEAVRRSVQGGAPPDSKGVDLLAAGKLSVRLVTIPAVLASIIRELRWWIGRNRARSVKLTLDGGTLEVSGVSAAEPERLIDLWVTRHAARG